MRWALTLTTWWMNFAVRLSSWMLRFGEPDYKGGSPVLAVRVLSRHGSIVRTSAAGIPSQWFPLVLPHMNMEKPSTTWLLLQSIKPTSERPGGPGEESGRVQVMWCTLSFQEHRLGLHSKDESFPTTRSVASCGPRTRCPGTSGCFYRGKYHSSSKYLPYKRSSIRLGLSSRSKPSSTATVNSLDTKGGVCFIKGGGFHISTG